VKFLFVVKNPRRTYLGPMYLSVQLKNAGHETFVAGTDLGRIRRLIEKESIDVIAFSVPTIHYGTCVKLARELKKSFDVPIIFGGPHATFFPEIIEEPAIDAVCVGEAENAILAFADNYFDGTTEIPNWLISKDGEIYRTDVGNLIENLDEIPHPDRELFREYTTSRVQFVMASRGCPFDCTYCFNHSYRKIYEGKGSPLRMRSPENIIEEVKQIQIDFPDTEIIEFADSTFNAKSSWVTDFAEKYRGKGLLGFKCCLRADLITEDQVALLAEAGCAEVGMGVESGNSELRQSLLKRKITNEQLIWASETIRKYDIRLQVGNVLAIPGGSLATDLETLELNMKMNTTISGSQFFQPYPKLQLTEKALELGLFDGDYENMFGGEGRTLNRHAPLKFADAREQMQIENLHQLFMLASQRPALLPVVKVLIKLPLGGLYHLIARAHARYLMTFKFARRTTSVFEILRRKLLKR
jgi:radical SAM superfamily enzyme YgiQ (UPF0313 family)